MGEPTKCPKCGIHPDADDPDPSCWLHDCPLRMTPLMSELEQRTGYWAPDTAGGG
jgi:hypothetical protein